METQVLTHSPHETAYGIVTPTNNNLFLIGVNLSVPASCMIVHEIVKSTHDRSRHFIIEKSCHQYVKHTVLNCKVEETTEHFICGDDPITIADNILKHNISAFVIVDIKKLKEVSTRLEAQGCSVRDADIVDNERIINDELYYGRFPQASDLNEKIPQAVPQYTIPIAHPEEEAYDDDPSVPSVVASAINMSNIINEADYHVNSTLTLFNRTNGPVSNERRSLLSWCVIS